MRTSVIIFSLLAIVASGCTKKVDSNDLKDEVPYYQYYEAAYDKTGNKTRAMASFRIREKSGAKIELTNGASVKLNSRQPTTSVSDKSTYHWNLDGNHDANFILKKNSGITLLNKTGLSGIGANTFEDVPVNISKSSGFEFKWQGDAVNEGETLTLNISGPATTGYILGKQLTEKRIFITPEELQNLPEGEITISLHREKNISLQNSDNEAGGQIRLITSVETKSVLAK